MRSITVEIAGQSHTIRSDAEPGYVRALASVVDGRIRDVQKAALKSVRGASREAAAMLVALQLADELEREKRGAVLGLPARFATGQSALGQYRGLVYFGLPLDYYSSFVANVNKVTLAQAAAAAAHQLKPGNAVYVVVGDADAKMIIHEKQGDKWADVPYMKDGQQLTLRQALEDLAKRGDVGKGGLVELDVEGHVLK